MAENPHPRPDDPDGEYPFVHRGENREDLEWIGVGDGPGLGTPVVYEPENHSVYEAEFDQEAEHVRVDESEKRELDEGESIRDVVAEVGDELGWTWLSAFAHDDLETTGHDAHLDVIDAAFERRNVPESADYDLGFYGDFTYRDDDGRVHTLERRFDVFTDEAHRTETDQPVAVVRETYLTAADPRAESRAGDAEKEGQTRREIPVDVDPDTGAELATIDEFCREWHEAHPEPFESSR